MIFRPELRGIFGEATIKKSVESDVRHWGMVDMDSRRVNAFVGGYLGSVGRSSTAQVSGGPVFPSPAVSAHGSRRPPHTPTVSLSGPVDLPGFGEQLAVVEPAPVGDGDPSRKRSAGSCRACGHNRQHRRRRQQRGRLRCRRRHGARRRCGRRGRRHGRHFILGRGEGGEEGEEIGRRNREPGEFVQGSPGAQGSAAVARQP